MWWWVAAAEAECSGSVGAAGGIRGGGRGVGEAVRRTTPSRSVVPSTSPPPGRTSKPAPPQSLRGAAAVAAAASFLGQVVTTCKPRGWLRGRGSGGGSVSPACSARPRCFPLQKEKEQKLSCKKRGANTSKCSSPAPPFSPPAPHSLPATSNHLADDLLAEVDGGRDAVPLLLVGLGAPVLDLRR